MTRRVYADRDLWPAERSLSERVLLALGADPVFIEAVLGDLAEEHAARAERDGVGVARLWYAREALRSAPFVVRNAMQHGSPRARARLAMTLAVFAMVVTVPVVAMLVRDGPPATLVADGGAGEGGIVVNNTGPRVPAQRSRTERWARRWSMARLPWNAWGCRESAWRNRTLAGS